MVTKKKRLVKKKRLTEPKFNFIVITDSVDKEYNYENSLEVAKFRTENQLKAYLVEFNNNSKDSRTIEVYKLGKKIKFTVQTNVERLVALNCLEEN